MDFAAYIPVGPAEPEIERVLDLLDSLAAYESGVKCVILVDDGIPSRALANRAAAASKLELIVLRNPREGRGQGWAGGLCVSNLVAFEYAQRRNDLDFVLKLDTDSLVVRPFLDRIASVLAMRTDVGLLGVIGDSFGPNRTFNSIQYTRSRLQQLLLLPKELDRVDSSSRPDFGWLRPEDKVWCSRLRSIVEQVIRRDGALGEYCQGGSYAVSRRFLGAMADAGYLKNPAQWRDLRVGEDVFTATCCAALGLRLVDFSKPGAAFAIHPNCLPFSCEELLALNRSIIHSLKGSSEEEFRSFFRRHRRLANESVGRGTLN